MGDSKALPLELFIRHNAGKAEQDTRRRPYKYLWPSISLALNSKASPTIIHNVATWRAISPSPYFCLSAVQHKVGHRLADVVVCPFIRPSILPSILPSIHPSIHSKIMYYVLCPCVKNDPTNLSSMTKTNYVNEIKIRDGMGNMTPAHRLMPWTFIYRREELN